MFSGMSEIEIPLLLYSTVFQLRKWADIFVIAPLDANTMAKMASGICDNLLVNHLHFQHVSNNDLVPKKIQTCVVRAWDPKCPLVYSPAMNTFMWNHPLTSSHIATLKQYGYRLVPPVSKLLACGDEGMYSGTSHFKRFE